jgi:L-serine dehydratase
VNIFDIIGPIMIGPSSSHTAGAVRIGRVSSKILGEDVAQAEIGLAGSFAQTYRRHGTDKALVAGLLGMFPDDERIRESFAAAREVGCR